jgi:hypothetical protein
MWADKYEIEQRSAAGSSHKFIGDHVSIIHDRKKLNSFRYDIYIRFHENRSADSEFVMGDKHKNQSNLTF